jgi:hypothetical protein
MALPGYPKTFDHPKQTFLIEGETARGNIAYIKAMGDDATDWVEYLIEMNNSSDTQKSRTVRVVVGNSLYGPFSSVTHNDEGASGASGSAQDCYTQVIETEI